MRWSVIEEDEFNVSTDKIYIYIYSPNNFKKHKT